MTDAQEDARYVDLALVEARRAADAGEVPIGAVVVLDGMVIARAHNAPITLHDPTAHAEVLALRAAARETGNYRLERTSVYTTVEPCLMCCGALVHARVARLVYGAADPKAGAVQTLFQMLADRRLNHQAQTVPGVLADQCGAMLSRFFEAQRRLGKK